MEKNLSIVINVTAAGVDRGYQQPASQFLD